MKHNVALTYSEARTHAALTVSGTSVFASPHPHWQEGGAALGYSRTVSVPHPHSPVVCLQVAGVALYPDWCRLDSRC